jgi:regulator of sigma D
MKKLVQKLSADQRIIYPIHDLVDGWYFRVEEVSQGYYLVEGIDIWGRNVSKTGEDPEQLLRFCKNDIEEKFAR